MRPVVTIGIPTCHRPAQLAEAITSVLSQDYGDWRLLVSDNSNLSENARIVTSFADARMTYVGQPVNLGAGGNFNYILGACRTPLCAILHDDDLYEHDYLDRMTEAMTRFARAGWGFCDAVWGDLDAPSGANARSLGSTVLFEPGDGFFLDVLSGAVRIPCPTVMFRMDTLGGKRFDLSYPAAGDTDLWLRLARRHPAVYVPAPMVRYRVWEDSDSTSSVTLGQVIVDTTRIRHEIIRDPSLLHLRHEVDAQFALRLRSSCRALLMSPRLADAAQTFPAVRRALVRQPGTVPRLTRTLLSFRVLVWMMLLLQPALRAANRRRRCSR